MSATNNSHASTRPAQRASFVRRTLFKQAELQSAKFGAVISSYAETLREVSAEIERRQPNDIAARLGSEASKYLDGVARYLTHTEGAVLVEDLESFATAQPVTAAVAAIAVGFVSARILKVSPIGSGAAA